MHQRWIVGAVIVIALWTVALGGRCALRRSRETAEKTAEFADRNLPETLTGNTRDRVVDTFISRVNRLSFHERQRLGADRRSQRFFEQLTDQERLRVFEETLPSGMSEMMEAFNRMDEEKRQAYVERARKRLHRVVGELETAASIEEQEQMEEVMKLVARHGFRAYLSEADAQSKLDLQPLMVQLQHMMQRAQW